MGFGIGNCFRANRCLKGLLYETIFFAKPTLSLPWRTGTCKQSFQKSLKAKKWMKMRNKRIEEERNPTEAQKQQQNSAYERNWYKEKAKIFEKESFPWHTRCDVDAVLDVSSERKYKNISYKNTRNINPWWFLKVVQWLPRLALDWEVVGSMPAAANCLFNSNPPKQYQKFVSRIKISLNWLVFTLGGLNGVTLVVALIPNRKLV